MKCSLQMIEDVRTACDCEHMDMMDGLTFKQQEFVSGAERIMYMCE